jgi:methylenetetrahydrofolate reductase (NADPH)
MLVRNILKEKRTTFSFEFFPPKTPEGWDKLFLTISDLIPLKPSWVSVTYGAGGSTRENTHNLVVKIRKETDLTVVTHLTCVEASREDIAAVIRRYDDEGIHNILALRGDPPVGCGPWKTDPRGFAYATDLVAFIKENFPHMCIGVAGFPEGHPESRNRIQEIEHLKAKIDAGADYIITQLFFDNRDYYDFCERCELAGIRAPIIAGIMPIVSRSGMLRMAELAARARIPAPLMRSVLRAENDKAVERVGIHWATEQVRDLLHNHAKGIHFYTLNNADATLKIYESLGVADSSQLT